MKINGKPDGGGGREPVVTSLSVTSNGIYTPATGVDGFTPVDVDVQPALESLSVTSNGTYTPGEGIDGYSQVSVNVQPTLGTLSVSVNNTYYPGQGVDGFSQVIVDVPQQVDGYTERNITERKYEGLVNLNNSASYVETYAFAYRSYPKTVYLPNASYIGSAAFLQNASLSSVDLPQVTKIEANAFAGCTKLDTLSLPNCKTISSGALTGNRLTSIELPKLQSFSQSVFYNCKSLSIVSLPVCNFIASGTFNNADNLADLYLGSNSVCTLENTNAFIYTSIASGTGTIHVPAYLVNAYKSANNWSTYLTQIIPIESLILYSSVLYGGTSTLDSTYLETLSISANDVTGVDLLELVDLGSSTFKNHQNLTSVNIPKVSYYGDETFAGCTGLSVFNITYPGLVSIGSDVFSGCTNLTTIYVPYGTISDYLSAPDWSVYSSLLSEYLPLLSFNANNGLLYGSLQFIDRSSVTSLTTINNIKTVDLPNCSYILSGTFSNAGNIETVSLANCYYIGNSAFMNATKLTSFYGPNVTYVGGIAFQGCPSLTELDLPNAGYLSGAFVAGNQNLTTLKIPAMGSTNSWYGNPAILGASSTLSQLYLGIDFYDVLPQSTVIKFNDTAFAQGTGSIYVHTNLYSSYIAADGWSTYASLFVSVGEASDVMLSFSDGLLYGNTKVLKPDYNTFLGISGSDITKISLPECRYLGASALYWGGLKNVSEIYLDNCVCVDSMALSLPTTINIHPNLYMGASSVCLLLYGQNLDQYQSIYVPSSLVDKYKSETYWRWAASKIYPIPE